MARPVRLAEAGTHRDDAANPACAGDAVAGLGDRQRQRPEQGACHHWTITPPDKDRIPGSPASPTSPPQVNEEKAGEADGDSCLAPTSPTSPTTTVLTSEDEVASQARQEYGPNLVAECARCEDCGAELFAQVSVERGQCERCHLGSKRGGGQ